MDITERGMVNGKKLEKLWRVMVANTLKNKTYKIRTFELYPHIPYQNKIINISGNLQSEVE